MSIDLHSIFSLDEKTGKLYWKTRDASMFSTSGQRSAEGCAANWNARYAGKECFTAVGNHGYKHGNVFGKGMLAHRVVFELENGFAPEYVDHIDGNKLNNAPSNLREATNGQNIANSRSRYGSSSSYLGVCYHKQIGRWVAHITKDYKQVFLGSFRDEKDAAIAYNRAAKEIHGEFARINNV